MPRCPICLFTEPPSVFTPQAEDSEADQSGTWQVVQWRMLCSRCGEYRISEDDRDVLTRGLIAASGPSFPRDRMHLVSAYLRELTIAGRGGVRVTAESATSMADAAPRTVSERANRLLLNLAGASRHAGDRITLFAVDDFPLAYAIDGRELMFMLHHLIDDGLLDGPPLRSEIPFFEWAGVSLKGWSRVEQLRSHATSFAQAFVAMSFDPAIAWIYTDGIAPAVVDAGYQPLILNRQEHADRVDERIVLEINRSRFVVAEFTQHRPSVYFEAGYAVGRGLPVIWTCRAGDYADAHFDTRQYNHIVWTTSEELRERLHTRIKVVIG